MGEIEEVGQLPAQSLAYIGDAVYELYVRGAVLEKFRSKPGKLHAMSIRYAQAKFQAKAALNLQAELTEEEKAILLRGRNANPGTMAKHASPQEYRWASGLETLIGYLYLSDRKKRLEELLPRIIEAGQEDEARTEV